GGALLKVVAGGFGCDLTGGSDVCADIKIVGIGNPTSIPIWGNMPNNTCETQFYLPNGNYKIEATFDQDPEEWGSFYVLATWSVLDSIRKPYNRHVGGLRIKKILSHDGVSSANDIIKNYRYTINLNSDTTSGRLLGTNSLTFVDNYTKWEWYFEGNIYTGCVETFLRLKGYSNAQMVSHSGSFIGYSKVITEYAGANKPGVTVQDFFSLPDQVKDETPYTPYETYEHFRGLPVKTTNYRIANNVYYPVTSSSFEYEESDTVAWAWNVKMGDEIAFIYNRADPELTLLAQASEVFPSTELYQSLSQASRLVRKKERVYDGSDTTKYLETVTDYEYNPTNLLLDNEVGENSKGIELKTKYYYPTDLSLSGDAETARQEMVTKNNLTTPLKIEKYTDNTLLETIKFNFKEHSGSVVLPDQILNGKGSLASSPETRVEFLNYDSKDNLLAQKKTDDITNSYIWGYDGLYPIASVINAASSNVYHTSFEDSDGNSSAGDSKTGRKSRTGGFSKNLTGLTNGTYTLSYWQKSGSWNFQTSTVTVSTGSYSLSLSGQIDEVRFYPTTAQMVTYTYEPLIGVSTECDINNRIVYYEYDGFGRLRMVKDQDKNIIKVLEYKHKQSQNQ
ncbi:MAG TPA: hypothetical protein VF476_12385, partial [Chitinophagaceae bacterium]